MHDSDVRAVRQVGFLAALCAIPILVIVGYIVYTFFRIDVPAMHVAVLTKKTGLDLENDQEVAPDSKHKGLQVNVLTEGRHFYNPYSWDWEIYPMVEIPEDKMGIRVRLYGDPLPYGHFVATEDAQKGIVKDVLRPGRYAINAIVKDEKGNLLTNRKKDDYLEIVELHEPTTIEAGYKGVSVNLAGPMPQDPNVLLVTAGNRGVQEKTLDPGTYYMNPYMYKIIPIDCRSQRYNLADSEDMGFPSKDGFWVSLDGIIEFRIKPDKASEVFVVYNEWNGDTGKNPTVDHEIIRKIIMPNARSFCRMRGSNNSGREFIGGETRALFQSAFQDAMRQACDQQGVEIVQALITKINPPQAIAGPVRDREVAHQKLKQYVEQKLQQEQEAKLAIEKTLIDQKKDLVGADQEVVKKVTKANEEQQVAVTKAEELKAVAERDLAAAKDQAEAILSRQRAEAGVIQFQNQAEAAGWKQAVASMGGGDEYARYVLYQKLAPSFRSIMTNTSDSPLMEVFKSFQKPSAAPNK